MMSSSLGLQNHVFSTQVRGVDLLILFNSSDFFIE